MTRIRQYWLMKTEPSTFSIYDLKSSKNQITHWEGVRNYQARNFMRSMCKKDLVFIYHSVVDPVGIFGIGEVVKEAYPDHFQFDSESKYYDPKSKPENPIWDMVDIKLIKIFKEPILLSTLKAEKELSEMLVAQKGSRLSVQPVEERHWEFILKKLASN
ncbi:MAG: EVE domain-containing protein [Candidatus Caenarcaniphilales bacterium]|nr:EVE domain-containing protein [Candidatus Caenarcaniphilales bacterium]